MTVILLITLYVLIAIILLVHKRIDPKFYVNEDDSLLILQFLSALFWPLWITGTVCYFTALGVWKVLDKLFPSKKKKLKI